MEVDGRNTTDDKEIASALQMHVSNFFTSENENVPETNYMIRQIITDTSINETITMKAIQEINPTKSQGPDNIHPRVVTECKHELCDPLSKIYRKSLNEGMLPAQWKNANVTAIFKSGKK